MRRDRPAIITTADTAAFVRPGNTAGIYRSASYGRIVKAVFDRTCIIAGHSAYRHSVRCDCTRSKILSVFKYPLVASGNAADGIITNYRAAVLALLEQNAHRAAEKTAPIPQYHTAETNRTERGKTQKIAPTGSIQRMVDRAAKRAEGKGIGYDRWAAVHNLKQMAATVAAMEQYGFTPDELDAALVSANADLHSSTAKLKPIETAIREKKDLQKQVLAYAKTRDVRDGLKKQKTDKARKAYREKHESDFIIADAAVRYFRQKGITKLPTYKSLQAEIEQLTAEKNALYNEYRANKERVRELQTMKSNLSQMHHGEPSRQKKHEQER